MKKQKQQKEQHPVLNQVLTPEFLKQFKDSGELNSFMEQLYGRAMEQMLEGEMDGHLGYEKHSAQGMNTGNSRNGKTSKTVKTTLGEIDLEVPRDRNGSFEPVLIPKRSRKVYDSVLKYSNLPDTYVHVVRFEKSERDVFLFHHQTYQEPYDYQVLQEVEDQIFDRLKFLSIYVVDMAPLFLISDYLDALEEGL